MNKKHILIYISFAILISGCFISTNLHVNTKTAEAASINKKKVFLKKGKSVQLSIKNSKGKVFWMSRKGKIATVNKKGKVSAKKEGNTVISAIVNGKQLNCKVIVEKPRLSKSSIPMQVGSSYSLKLLGTKRKVKWSSTKTSVATVDSKGKVKAKKIGKTSIVAKLDKKKYTCKVTVSNVVPTVSPLVPTFSASGLTGRLIQENKGTATTSVYLDLKNNTSSSIEIESGVYLNNPVLSNIRILNLSPMNIAPGADVHLELFTDYADANSQAIISFYSNGYNYTAIVNTTGVVSVQSPTASASEAHYLMAAYFVTLLKEVLIQPDAIVVNRIKAGTKVINGRVIPVCELDLTLKNSSGASVRVYYLVRQHGRPSTAQAIYSPSVGYIWAGEAWTWAVNTFEDNDIVVSGMLDTNAIMNAANQFFAARNYQLINK